MSRFNRVIIYKKPRLYPNVHPFSVRAVTVDLLSKLPHGNLTQEGRLNFEAIDEPLYQGMAIFGVVGNDWTPLELYYLMKQLNGEYMLDKDNSEVYEDMCQEFDPRIIRGFHLKRCGGPWVKYSSRM